MHSSEQSPSDRTHQATAGAAAADATDRSAQADLALHQQLLAMIARAEPLADTLTAMCIGIEQRYEGSHCSVLLVDEGARTLHHIAAPTLPRLLTDRLDGMAIADGAGACGTAAATGQVVVVDDTLTDPLTEDLRDVARSSGMRSVWSAPLLSADGAVLGTFALYRRTAHTPDPDEQMAVVGASRLGAVAIERHRTEQALLTAATTDALTGLPNRDCFMGQLDAQLASPDVTTAVLFMDVDQFKLINDSLGHPAGDRLLIEMAGRLCAAVPAPHVVARFGGDEFTVLIIDAHDATVDQVADAVEGVFEQPFAIPGGAFLMTGSMGIAVAEGGAAIDGDSLIRDADTAMYAAKAARAVRVDFDDRLRRRVLTRMSLENALQRGLAEDEFEVWYQPIIDVRTGKRTSVEALVRWTHPQRGPLSPEAFIGLAEETGLIVPLGARVLDIAIRQGAAMAEAGRPLTIAVNVSAIQLSDPSFGAHVVDALDKNGLAAEHLMIELTESVAVARGAAPRRSLALLAEAGVRLLIDDFGTGYSSIPLLRELPVVGLKVDSSFTMALASDDRMGRVIGAVTDLAHALDLFVVAEGVDTADALTQITRLGCDFAQGFHLSLPVSGGSL